MRMPTKIYLLLSAKSRDEEPEMYLKRSEAIACRDFRNGGEGIWPWKERDWRVETYERVRR